MSAEVNPSLVNWLTSMMTMRLQVILEHIPITEEQITHYVIHTQVRFNTFPWDISRTNAASCDGWLMWYLMSAQRSFSKLS